MTGGRKTKAHDKDKRSEPPASDREVEEESEGSDNFEDADLDKDDEAKGGKEGGPSGTLGAPDALSSEETEANFERLNEYKKAKAKFHGILQREVSTEIQIRLWLLC